MPALAIPALALLFLSTALAKPPPIVDTEVEYLLTSIETSNCTFYRNGTWYSAARAEAHLKDKYDYLVARNLIATTEDFIDKGATRSSLSGRPYKIKCGIDAETETGTWLHVALARYRASGHSVPAVTGRFMQPRI